MAEFAFQGVRAIVADRDKGFRHTLHSMLRPLGFESLHHTDNLDQVIEAIVEAQVDVVIGDLDVGSGEFPNLARRVRHHEVGENPFLILIVLATEPAPEAVRAIIDSGSDDLLVKPVSAGTLIERLRKLAISRKRFVVTTDYVGPDRRTGGPRPGTQEIPLVDVPNPLAPQARANTEAYQRAIDAAIREVNEQKVERHAFQIGYLVNRIAPAYLMGDPVETIRPDLERLLYVSEDIGRRLLGSKYAHIGQLCGSMRKVASRVHGRIEKPDEKDIRLLPEISAAIRQACDTSAATVAIARDITASLVGRSA